MAGWQPGSEQERADALVGPLWAFDKTVTIRRGDRLGWRGASRIPSAAESDAGFSAARGLVAGGDGARAGAVAGGAGNSRAADEPERGAGERGDGGEPPAGRDAAGAARR